MNPLLDDEDEEVVVRPDGQPPLELKADPHDVALALADKDLGLGHWLACRQPFTAPDDMTVFVLACSHCQHILYRIVSAALPPPLVYPGWWERRREVVQMMQRPTVKMIARRRDRRWRNR